NTRHLGIGEQARWDDAVAGRAIYSSKVVANNAKIVERDMSELRTAGAFTDRPHIGERLSGVGRSPSRSLCDPTRLQRAPGRFRRYWARVRLQQVRLQQGCRCLKLSFRRMRFA